MATVYISIGNSDDKLTQAAWSNFVSDVIGWADWATEEGGRIHGVFYSLPDSRYQNMCVQIEAHEDVLARLRRVLPQLAAKYNQDSIAWLEGITEFLSGPANDG